MNIKFLRPEVERYGQDSMRECLKPRPFQIGPFSEELMDGLPYKGKDKDSVIFELCCYIRQLELERTSNHE